MSGKDPFQILADEITLIRTEIERLQRTSLNKDEAKALHKIVTEKTDEMLKQGSFIESKIDRRLDISTAAVEQKATKAAQSAAEGAIRDTHAEVVKTAQKLLDDAQTIRSVAWRQFGDFWAWIACTAAVCLLGGALASMAMQARGDAKEFGRYAGIYCSSAGGERVTGADGTEYCAIRLD